MFENLNGGGAALAQNAENNALAAKDNSGMWDFFGTVVNTGGGLWTSLNPKVRDNELAIAQANAAAAQANAQANTAQPRSQTVIWVVVVLAILILAFLLFSKSTPK